jgi:hypothetical protein
MGKLYMLLSKAMEAGSINLDPNRLSALFRHSPLRTWSR